MDLYPPMMMTAMIAVMNDYNHHKTRLFLDSEIISRPKGKWREISAEMNAVENAVKS